jgi:tRNA(fMet)-specific endonuclease VapC
MYLLDTNIISFWIRGIEPVGRRIRATAPAELAVSAVSQAELWYGVQKTHSRKLERAVSEALEGLVVLPFDPAAARSYGVLRAHLERQGRPIEMSDTMIAAHALSSGCTLVTNNRKHFERIAGLTVEDWT